MAIDPSARIRPSPAATHWLLELLWALRPLAWSLALWPLLWLLLAPHVARAQGSGGTSCDPARMTCVPAPCSAIDQALGRCGSGGGGGGGRDTGGGSCPYTPPGGNPDNRTSCRDGPAARPGSGPGTGAGNPINLLSGNKYQQEVDLAPLPGVLGLELVRHYNSMSTHHGLTGAHWRISYEAVLYDLGGSLQIVQADGRRLMFTRDGRPGTQVLCTGSDPADGQVSIDASNAEAPVYRWRWPDGRVLLFADGRNGGHPLQAITAPTGERVTLTYTARGELMRVRDPQGRQLSFNYDRRGQLIGITTPLGRIDYRRDAQHRLIEAQTHAAGQWRSSRVYHYESPQQAGHPLLLTGISQRTRGDQPGEAAREQRLSSYAYDAQGRAVMSMRADGVERIDVGYLGADRRGRERVRVTNSLGGITTLELAPVAGQPRLVEVRGAGCSSCPTTDRRYDYDAQGRLVREHRLDADGRARLTRHTGYDGYGRVMREGLQIGSATIDWRLRYAYEDQRFDDGSIGLGQQPVRVTRPSVLPGREATLALAYNDAGEITRVDESGFSPPRADGADAEPISRSTRHDYREIGGQLRLVRIVGPLVGAATAADDDAIELTWDTRGERVTSLRQPGGFENHIGYDALGRVSTVRDEAGTRLHFDYDALGRLAQLTRAGPGDRAATVQRVRYDALGHAVAMEGEGAQWLRAFDAAGRLRWQASSLGMLTRLTHDSESRVVERKQLSSTMSMVARFVRDARGEVVAVRDGDGRLRWHAGDDAPVAEPPGAAHRVDDFGRVVESVHVDSGRVQRAFDAADRLVWMRDALGNEARYAYDAAGRIVHQQLRAAATGALTDTRWRYDGRHRVEVTHPTQREQQAFGPEGWPQARTVTLIDGSGREHVAVMRYTHDAQGRLASRTLADGSRIVYERNGQGQVVALWRHRVQTPWLQHLERPQPIVRDLQRDLVALRSATAGNGVQNHWLRSPDGTLARVLVRAPLPARVGAPSAPSPAAAQLSLAPLFGPTRYQRPAAPHWLALLGMRDAQASKAGATSPDASGPTAAVTQGAAGATRGGLGEIGALGAAADPTALIDHRYLWDVRGNLLLQQQRASGGRRDLAFAYDAADRLIVAEQRAAADPAEGLAVQTGAGADAAITSRYFHDARGRRVLAQPHAPDGDPSAPTQRTRYDGDSHRWQRDDDAHARYDASGQPIEIGARRLTWDGFGRLLQVEEAGRPLAVYRYDHRGLRIEKQWEAEGAVAGRALGVGARLFLYDEDRQPAADLDAEGRILRQYVFLAERPVAVIDTPTGRSLAALDAKLPLDRARGLLRDLRALAGSWVSVWIDAWGDADALFHVHTNHLGAPEAVTDRAARVVWRARYDAFGAAQVTTSPARPFTLDLRLPGQIFDAETGLHYNRARYYDPARGQYLTPDPLAQHAGYPDGPNPYAYVRYSPLKYVDPSGLILFAFDGTGNTDDPAQLARLGGARTNVARFRDAYGDGSARYVSGVGTVHRDAEWGDIDAPLADAGINRTGTRRIERMLTYLLEEARSADDDIYMHIDIVGFSRGAAQARDFANQINSMTDAQGWLRYNMSFRNARGEQVRFEGRQCVRFRFMGLFDTVLSTNSGRSYNMGIPSRFEYVAHAVALNEYRSQPYSSWGALGNLSYWNQTRVNLDGARHFGGFPLESIGAGSDRDGAVRVERGFIGAHADIGGGYPEGDNQLSFVALNWMVAQAVRAGVSMNAGVVPGLPSSNPVLHDQSNAILVGNPIARPTLSVEMERYVDDRVETYEWRLPVEDRTVSGAVSGNRQRSMGFGGGSMTNEHTHRYIDYFERSANRPERLPEHIRNGNRTGRVDINGYLAWLRANGYCLDMAADCARPPSRP